MITNRECNVLATCEKYYAKFVRNFQTNLKFIAFRSSGEDEDQEEEEEDEEEKMFEEEEMEEGDDDEVEEDEMEDDSPIKRRDLLDSDSEGEDPDEVLGRKPQEKSTFEKQQDKVTRLTLQSII